MSDYQAKYTTPNNNLSPPRSEKGSQPRGDYGYRFEDSQKHFAELAQNF